MAFEEEQQQKLLEGQSGVQQQLYSLAAQVRRIDERLNDHIQRQRDQHKENSDRLEELETVVVKGNGEFSLVRKIDGVVYSVNQIINSVSNLSSITEDLAGTIGEWKGRLSERMDQQKKHRWQIGDVLVPFISIIIASGATVLIEHMLRK